jgi:hypothetical protein
MAESGLEGGYVQYKNMLSGDVSQVQESNLHEILIPLGIADSLMLHHNQYVQYLPVMNVVIQISRCQPPLKVVIQAEDNGCKLFSKTL